MKPALSLTITIILASIISSNAQITFSRDWFAGSGKRSDPSLVIHKPHKRGNGNLDMMRTVPYAHIQRSPLKKGFVETGLGELSGNHIKDLNRAIKYLQNLKNGLLTEEFDDLAEEAQQKVDGNALDVKGNFEEYIPRSFNRL